MRAGTKSTVCKVIDGHKKEKEEAPLLQAFFTFLSYTIIQIFGQLRKLMIRVGLYKRKGAVDNNTKVSKA
jgi:hypothetical protein